MNRPENIVTGDRDEDKYAFAAFRLQLVFNGEDLESKFDTDKGAEFVKFLDQLAEIVPIWDSTCSFSLASGTANKVANTTPAKKKKILGSFTTEMAVYMAINLYGRQTEHPENDHPVGIPYFGFNKAGDYEWRLELAVPPEADYIPELVKLIETWLPTWGPEFRFGLMGYGIFTLPKYDSVIYELAKYSKRYRCCLSSMTYDLEQFVIPSAAMELAYKTTPLGVPDIGWKTIVGKHFFDRLDVEALRKHSSETVSIDAHDNALVITAGETPIWGDVNYQEDSSAYQEIRKLLDPIWIDEVVTGKLQIFGSRTEETLRYIRRFEV